MGKRNDILIYQSEDGLVRMEALVDHTGETIWATQKAIAAEDTEDAPVFSAVWTKIEPLVEGLPLVAAVVYTTDSGLKG